MKHLLLLCLLLPRLCFGVTEIGMVVAVYGTVKAERDGEENFLERGASIFLNDLIKVAEDSRAQLKLTDGSLLNLIPNTLYRVNTYTLRAPDEKDSFVSELMKGGMRGITGSIAKINPAGVALKTPTATMGLRGTIFEVLIAGEGTFFGCESGLISITNGAGMTLLGPSSPRQFGMVHSPVSAVQTIPKRPDVLRLNRFITPRGACH